MTTKEFSSEFDILYDNASKGAPGLDLYEKSVFLTQAQEEIVKEAYSGYSRTGVSFEGSERRRRQLSELVKDYWTTTEAPSEQQETSTLDSNNVSRKSDTNTPNYVDMNIVDGSVFYFLPTEVMYLVFERVTLNDNRIINVTPVTHDEFNQSIKNPFRKPSRNIAWRLDVQAPGAYMKVEIVANQAVKKYHIRYVKKPNAIILSNFESDDELAGLGLTVDGDNIERSSELNNEMHRDILSRAVEIAVLVSRENTLQNKVKLNRNIV